MEYELLIREADPADATELVTFLNRVSIETDFTSLDKDGLLLTSCEMEVFLEKQASSDNQITLLALLDGEIAGLVNITKINENTAKITNSTVGLFINPANTVTIRAARASHIVTRPGITISSIANTAVAIAQNIAPIKVLPPGN